MGTSDGAVIGATKIVDHGSDAARWTMVIVADGYRSNELPQFHTDAQNFVNTLVATAPFDGSRRHQRLPARRAVDRQRR